MRRDITQLKNEVFDVLIIGAGIHGAVIAWMLSSAGYKTALIDANDFGGATSANSLKIIHGGLRYLQQADFKRIRESVISRKIIQRVAPYCVRNIPCIIPTRGFGFRSKFALYVAMKLYDLVSVDKNWSLPHDQKILKGYTISKKELLSIVPGISSKYTNGGAVWYETLAENSERIVLEFIHLAFQAGCTVGNYIRALKINHFKNVVQGINAKDTLSGEEFEVKSKIIINSTGPWLNNLLKDFNTNQGKEVPLCKAINIIVNKNLFNNYAVGLEGTREFKEKDSIIQKGKRLFFFVPWKNHTMIGTSYSNYSEDSTKLKIEKEDLEKIIEEVNLIYPLANLKIEDITYYHAGILPRDAKQELISHEIQPAKKSYIIDEVTQSGLKGLYSVLSVKYTTAPFIALKLRKLLKRMHPEISTNNTAMKSIGSIKKTENDIRLFTKYGPHSKTIQEYFRNDPLLKEVLCDNSKITEGEIKYFIEEECAVRLEDIIFRRTDIGTNSFPGRDFLIILAQKMSYFLKWKGDRMNLEVENVINKYSPLQVK